MSRAILSLFIGIAVACTLPNEPRRVSSEGSTNRVLVRVVAANLTSGNKQTYDPGHGARILKAVDADVVLLQEFNVGDNTESEIEAWVESTFGADASYVRGTDAGIPNGIVTNLPILEAGVWRDPNVHDRDFTYARLDVPGERDLWAVSVHFLTTKSTDRQQQARALVARIRDDVPEGDYLVVGGDLNTTSRGERALDVLADVVEVDGPYPADQAGNGNTNQNRNEPYDWVLADDDLAPHAVATVIGTSEFSAGAVIDTRVHEPLSDLVPARRSDSGALNMQHMAVVRDFALPGGPAEPDAGAGAPVDAGADAGLGDSDAAADGGGDSLPPGGEPEVIINEVLANEPGSDPAGEFVEIVNVGDAAADLEGWTLGDATATRHAFAGTVLEPGEAWVVYAGADAIPPELERVEASSTGVLSLANGGDSVVLSDDLGRELDRVDYGSSLAGSDGVSMNRQSDGRAGAELVLHTELAGADSSPGTRADGAPF